MPRWTLAACLLFLPQEPLSELDSPDPGKARRAFEAVIRAADEKALEAAALKSERAKRALAEVRAHKRFGASYPAVKTLALELKDEPFESALDKFSKAAGVELLPYDSGRNPMKPADRITLTLEDAYFLEALDRFGESAGITIHSLPQGLRYSAGGGSPRKICYARHMSLSVRSIREERSANAIGQAKSGCYLDFVGRSSGVMRIAAHGQFRFLEVWGVAGASLIPEKIEKWPPTGAWSASASFATGSYIKLPAGEIDVLPVVRGVLEVLIPEEPRFAELDLGGPIKECSADNIRLILEQVLEGGASIKVTSKIQDSQKPHVRPIVADFTLKSSDGRVIEAKGSVSGSQNAPEANLTFQAPDGFKPAALRVRHFAAYGSLEIPFEFRDVRIR